MPFYFIYFPLNLSILCSFLPIFPYSVSLDSLLPLSTPASIKHSLFEVHVQQISPLSPAFLYLSALLAAESAISPCFCFFGPTQTARSTEPSFLSWILSSVLQLTQISPSSESLSLWESVLPTCHLPTIARMIDVPQKMCLRRPIYPENNRCSFSAHWSILLLVRKRKWKNRDINRLFSDPSPLFNLFSVHFFSYVFPSSSLGLCFIFLPVLFSHSSHSLTSSHILFLLFILWKISKTTVQRACTFSLSLPFSFSFSLSSYLCFSSALLLFCPSLPPSPFSTSLVSLLFPVHPRTHSE